DIGGYSAHRGPDVKSRVSRNLRDISRKCGWLKTTTLLEISRAVHACYHKVLNARKALRPQPDRAQVARALAARGFLSGRGELDQTKVLRARNAALSERHAAYRTHPQLLDRRRARTL